MSTVRRPSRGQYRKLYRMHAEAFDAERSDWRYLGMVLLPDNAYRGEVAHVLAVFGLRGRPAPSDRLQWSYACHPGPPGSGPQFLPRARIDDLRGTPVARLVPHSVLPGFGEKSEKSGKGDEE